MSKAFTLFEFILSLLLFAIIASLLSKPLSNFHLLNFNALKTHELITQTHLNLLKIEKLIQNCTQITFLNQTLQCFLKDQLINLKDNKLYLINSALLLENKNKLYLPKSDLNTLFQNRKDLYNDNDYIIYALKNNQIETISLQNNTIIANFTGFFTPLQAQLTISLANKELSYELKPKFNDKLKQQGLLEKNISVFQIQNNKLKICSKEQTEYCLEKRLLL
ncbi:hypothetical protein LNU06_03880 [Campylobacter sp. VicNov18]|uniref:hypothetical protein n=1 Tax=Campylobacter bilis TaxID=2691918 RepID=UPI00130E4D3E|nr:hypothetical protein [Campylobacter bilis]MPV63677.1 hypothetical protein [Campylobacter hepaticus]MBM0637178.1 hypothetical protein [Campylobacter bilis]MCC8277894.1 hypothetical protein [Campylobacter bilis]MCC8298825.1 hypothetical protein [Campylobacter bilis]MCC8300804.1 hypothetical protein [Campylobacter bilis]